MVSAVQNINSNGTRSAIKRNQMENWRCNINFCDTSSAQSSTLWLTSSKFREFWNTKSTKAKFKMEDNLTKWDLWRPELSLSRTTCGGYLPVSTHRRQLPTTILNVAPPQTIGNTETQFEQRIWNNWYGNRNCNVRWRKEVFLGTLRQSHIFIRFKSQEVKKRWNRVFERRSWSRICLWRMRQWLLRCPRWIDLDRNSNAMRLSYYFSDIGINYVSINFRRLDKGCLLLHCHVDHCNDH